MSTTTGLETRIVAGASELVENGPCATGSIALVSIVRLKKAGTGYGPYGAQIGAYGACPPQKTGLIRLDACILCLHLCPGTLGKWLQKETKQAE